MSQKDVKFGEWIGESFDLYKDNIVTLILASLVATALSSITMGILAGPMLAGLVMLVLEVSRDKNEQIEVTRVFDGFQFFLPFFLFLLGWGAVLVVASVVLNFVVCVGHFAFLAGTVALSALLMFAPFLMVDKRMSFWDASLASIDAVKSNFWPLLGYSVVASAIGLTGSLVCGIGVFVTAPLALCLIAVAYRELGIGDLAPSELPVEEVPLAEEPIEVEVKAPVPEPVVPSGDSPATASGSNDEEPKPQG